MNSNETRDFKISKVFAGLFCDDCTLLDLSAPTDNNTLGFTQFTGTAGEFMQIGDSIITNSSSSPNTIDLADIVTNPVSNLTVGTLGVTGVATINDLIVSSFNPGSVNTATLNVSGTGTINNLVTSSFNPTTINATTVNASNATIPNLHSSAPTFGTADFTGQSTFASAIINTGNDLRIVNGNTLSIQTENQTAYSTIFYPTLNNVNSHVVVDNAASGQQINSQIEFTQEADFLGLVQIFNEALVVNEGLVAGSDVVVNNGNIVQNNSSNTSLLQNLTVNGTLTAPVSTSFSWCSEGSNTTGSTTLYTTNQSYQLNYPQSINSSSGDWAQSVGGGIVYNGTGAGFQFVMCGTFTTSVPCNITFNIGITGNIDQLGTCIIYSSGSGSVGFMLCSMENLNTGDDVEIWASSDTFSTTITLNCFTWNASQVTPSY